MGAKLIEGIEVVNHKFRTGIRQTSDFPDPRRGEASPSDAVSGIRGHAGRSEILVLPRHAGLPAPVVNRSPDGRDKIFHSFGAKSRSMVRRWTSVIIEVPPECGRRRLPSPRTAARPYPTTWVMAFSFTAGPEVFGSLSGLNTVTGNQQGGVFLQE